MGLNKVWSENDAEVEPWEEVRTKADVLKESTESSRGLGPNFEEQIGICATCRYHEYMVNDVHQIVFNHCGYHGVRLGKHKIMQCNKHSRKNELDLSTMYQIATLIDIPKDKAGFVK